MRYIVLKEGMRIHLKTREGMYTIVKVDNNGIHYSAKVWIARANYPDIIPTKYALFTDVKCLAGGYNNPNVEAHYVRVRPLAP